MMLRIMTYHEVIGYSMNFSTIDAKLRAEVFKADLNIMFQEISRSSRRGYSVHKRSIDLWNANGRMGKSRTLANAEKRELGCREDTKL